MRCSAKSSNVCKPLDYERQKELFGIAKVESWARRQRIFRAGDPIESIFKVTSGMAALSKVLPDGRRQVLDFFLPGDLCGFFELGKVQAFDCEAITETTTCSFDRDRLQLFSKRHAAVAEAVRHATANRLKRAALHMAVLGQLTSTERGASFLCCLATAYGEHDVRTSPLALPMNRTDIADYLGLRLETVSRAFSRLRQRRCIELENDAFVVTDQAALRAMSNSPYLA